MPWKNEIDRMVNRSILDAAKGGENEVARGIRTIKDLLELSPDRAQSHYHLGTADELISEAIAEEFEASEGEAARWRHLGQLEASARRGRRERVEELMADEKFEEALANPEGRIALRAVGRMLLRDGKDQQVFDYYTQHLVAVDDEGSRRDAEFLLEEALRRADRYDRSEPNEGESLTRLDRAAAFVENAKLEPRAGAKVDRKMGRVHQLAERWEDAVECYRRALDRLPDEDPYRSVLVGDLALATLGVRGTLDLLPEEEREGRDEAKRILSEESQGEGRSYNAIYTLGMLFYEEGNFEDASRCLAEADQLMRENRAKARIVHARSRFFLGHCMLELGVEGEELDQAQRNIQRDAGASNLDNEIKESVFEALLEVVPDARIPGRRGGRGRRERRPRGRDRDRDRDQDRDRDRGEGDDREKAPALAPAVEALQEAHKLMKSDPHAALQMVDRAFKSRPDFETWYGAYRARLDALVALNEREEALRTYERFRAKLYQRNTFDRIESLLDDADSPVASLLDDVARNQELVDLYEVMPDRDGKFVEACVTCATAYLEAGDDALVGKALSLAREASARDEDAVAELLGAATKAAKKAGLLSDDPSEDDYKARISELDEKPHILLVGGDEGRRPHLERFQELAERVGFEGDWIFTGARPPHKTLQEIEDSAQHTSAILIHHGAGADVREEVKKLADELEVPVREVAWMGQRGVETEVLLTLGDAVPAAE